MMRLRTLLFTLAVATLPTSGLQGATVSYWTLDEATGNYVDSVGSNDLVREGGTQNTTDVADVLKADASDTRPGNFGSQTDVLGKGPHIPLLDLVAGTGWTLEGYLQTSSTARQFIAANNPGGNTTTGAWDLEMTFNPGNAATVGRLALRVQQNDGTSNVVTTTDLFPTDDAFHHWAITWDPTNTDLSLYVDGVEQASATVPIQSPTATSKLFHIGGFLLTNGSFHTSLELDGRMDELRLSSGVLAPTEFLNAVVPAPGTLSAGFVFVIGLAISRRRG